MMAKGCVSDVYNGVSCTALDLCSPTMTHSARMSKIETRDCYYTAPKANATAFQSLMAAVQDLPSDKPVQASQRSLLPRFMPANIRVSRAGLLLDDACFIASSTTSTALIS